MSRLYIPIDELRSAILGAIEHEEIHKINRVIGKTAFLGRINVALAHCWIKYCSIQKQRHEASEDITKAQSEMSTSPKSAGETLAEMLVKIAVLFKMKDMGLRRGCKLHYFPCAHSTTIRSTKLMPGVFSQHSSCGCAAHGDDENVAREN